MYTKEKEEGGGKACAYEPQLFILPWAEPQNFSSVSSFVSKCSML